jgi:beta-N-acetylhexosaminidase
MPTDAGRAIDAMVHAVESGRIPRERVDQSVRKILTMKQQLGLFTNRFVDLNKVSSVVDRADFRTIGQDAIQRSITLLKDSLGTVDQLRSGPQSVMLVVMAESGTTLGPTLASELRRHGWTLRQVTLPLQADSATRDSVVRSIDRSSVALIVAAVKVGAGKGTISLPVGAEQAINAIVARQPTVLVSFGSPYLISQVPSVQSYLLAWTANTASETAVANALTGTAITGRSPILIPNGGVIGTGLQRSGH